MLTLAVDTANRRGGLALSRDGSILASRTVDAPDGFAGVVFGGIESLLTAAGLSIADVDLWAAAAGPGSFTGVRVGLAAVKALAEAHGKLAMAVSNLEALAYGAKGPIRTAAIDARRGQVFWGVYDACLAALVEPRVTPWELLRAELVSRGVRLAVAEEESFVHAGIERVELIQAPAESLAMLAEDRAAAGQASPPEGIRPVYVRKPDVREPG